jgi:hypothetical protein
LASWTLAWIWPCLVLQRRPIWRQVEFWYSFFDAQSLMTELISPPCHVMNACVSW